MRTTLFHYKDPGIEITIEAYFNGDNLLIEGYDIGPRVEEAWGDSDYEYSMTLNPDSVTRLAALFNLPGAAKEELLQQLARDYKGNSSFSQIRNLLSEHHIPFDSSSWT